MQDFLAPHPSVCHSDRWDTSESPVNFCWFPLVAFKTNKQTNKMSCFPEEKTEQKVLLEKEHNFLEGLVYPRMRLVTKVGVARTSRWKNTLMGLKTFFLKSKTYFPSAFLMPHPTPITIKKELLAKSSWHSSLIYMHFIGRLKVTCVTQSEAFRLRFFHKKSIFFSSSLVAFM